jgi:pimeloyl-ACP methyl ester carboxylesterase
MDAERGYWGTLLPMGSDSYLFAPARSGRFPVDLRVEFSRDTKGVGTILSMTGTKTDQVVANRIDAYETSDIRFQSDGVTLAGTLLSPRRRGIHPAVVMVHSSGNQSRNGPVAYFRLIADFLATNGITTLVYDKRGVGSSTGNWTTATFGDLAANALAAVAVTRRQSGVDPDRVGLWSLSQGGWVAPLAASVDPRIRFLSLVSAAATTPAQQEIDRVSLVMQANGFTSQEVESGERFLHTFFDVVSGSEQWETLESAIANTASQRWVQYVPRPKTPDDVSWAPAPATLDPSAIFQKVRVPVLAIHGTDDLDVPAQINSPKFAKLSTHRESRQRIFEHADHYMLVGVANTDLEYRRLSSGYLRLIIDWIPRASK